MDDGVVLDGAIWRPQGVHDATVVLHALPYAAMCSVFPEAPYPKPCAPEVTGNFWLDEYNGLPRNLVEQGYTFIQVSVRGTGASGGCFTYLGERERLDLGQVIDQVLDREGVDGVGMLGLSYMAITPVEAMLARPDAVKAIVIGGIGVDEYTYAYTPQGASSLGKQEFWGVWLTSVQGPPVASMRAMEAYPQRLCPDLVTLALTPPAAHTTDTRPASFYLDRRYVNDLKERETGVLVVNGLLDYGSGMQIEELWPALDGTPHAFVLGQWDHRFPDDALLSGSGLNWQTLAPAWFDHFLRNGPEPPLLGQVHVEVEGGGWTHAEQWPPSLTHRAFYVGDTLASTSQAGVRSFRSVPEGSACENEADTWFAALTDPLPSDTPLLGNPMVWLELETDRPSATVAVDLWDVSGNDVCSARLISMGAADLRFRNDPFQGQDAPVGQILGTRIDLHAVAWNIPAGHRIGITVSSAGALEASGRPNDATLTVHGTSHLLLPMHAALGGPLPGIQYPPRPFAPNEHATQSATGL